MDLPIQTSVTSPDSPKTMSVTLGKKKTEVSQGLEAVPVPVSTSKQQSGYNITYKVCIRCGTDAADSDKPGGKTEVCSWCKGTDFKTTERLHGGKIAAIINTKLGYKCTTCSKVYEVPTKCCLGNYEAADKTKELKEAYMCTACRTVYYRKPEMTCCTQGRMMKGKAYKATYGEYLALPKIYKPIY